MLNNLAIEKLETLEEFKNAKQLALYLDQTVVFFGESLKGILWPNGNKKTAVLFLEKSKNGANLNNKKDSQSKKPKNAKH